MVMKTVGVLALVGVGLIVLNWPPTGVEANAADFDAACREARQHLREGRCREAMTTITTVEDAVRANVERKPGRELSVLMIKARAYWHQMDTEGMERFLTRFEKEYADTSAVSWVQRAACYERMLGYRFAGDLPQAARAFEKYRELEEQYAARQSQVDTLDAVAQDFDVHVVMPAQIGDLYRYMGRMDLAVEKYQSALEYMTAHAETFRPLEENPQQLIGTLFTPSKYRDELFPTAIRECEAPQGSSLDILGRNVICEVQQADWLLSVGRGCCQQRAFDSAREHYRKAQQALDAHRVEINSLSPSDKARYLRQRERISNSVAICQAESARLNEGYEHETE